MRSAANPSKQSTRRTEVELIVPGKLSFRDEEAASPGLLGRREGNQALPRSL
jgi:hypothetical protein